MVSCLEILQVLNEMTVFFLVGFSRKSPRAGGHAFQRYGLGHSSYSHGCKNWHISSARYPNPLTLSLFTPLIFVYYL